MPPTVPLLRPGPPDSRRAASGKLRPQAGLPAGGKRVIGTAAHYADLKIAEGCNNRCHYCAIPGIRGPLRSRDMADCLAEARSLAGEGVKELIVVAQDPTAYGEDWGKPGSLCELLDGLNAIPGIEWVRNYVCLPGAHHGSADPDHAAG